MPLVAVLVDLDSLARPERVLHGAGEELVFRLRRGRLAGARGRRDRGGGDGLRHRLVAPVEPVVRAAARAGRGSDLKLGDVGEGLAERLGEPVRAAAERERGDVVGEAPAPDLGEVGRGPDDGAKAPARKPRPGATESAALFAKAEGSPKSPIGGASITRDFASGARRRASVS